MTFKRMLMEPGLGSSDLQRGGRHVLKRASEGSEGRALGGHHVDALLEGVSQDHGDGRRRAEEGEGRGRGGVGAVGGRRTVTQEATLRISPSTYSTASWQVQSKVNKKRHGRERGCR